MEKMKKALIIFASPHQNGSTAKVLNFLKKEIKSEFDFYTIDVYERKPKPCVDCGKCKESRDCVFHDLEDLNHYLGICDLVVFAFPVYNYSFPAPLKAVIDRMQRYYNFKKNKGTSFFKSHPKHGLVLLTAGSFEFEKSIISAQIEPVLKLLNVTGTNYIILKNTDDKKLNIDKFLLKSKNSIKDMIVNLN